MSLPGYWRARIASISSGLSVRVAVGTGADVDKGVDIATSGGSGVLDADGSVAFTDAGLLVAQAFTSNGRTNTNQ